MAAFRLLLWLQFVCFSLFAQVDLLTVREAESIVDRIPEVTGARQAGKCPQFEVTFPEPAKLWVQVRAGCGPAAGQLLDNYTVDRATGDVVTWGPRSTALLNAEGKAYARHLAEQARSRRLNMEEARCLALVAARAGPSLNPGILTATAEALGKEQMGRLRFATVSRLAGQPVQIARTLSVDLGSGHVRDDDIGLEIVSGPLSVIVEKMLILRRPALLSEAEALLVALATPFVARLATGGCIVTGGGATSASELFAGVSCGGQSRGPSLSIDLRSGRVIDADNHKVLDSPASKYLAGRLLASKEREQSDLAADAIAACRDSR